MALDLVITLVAGFLAVALVAGYGTSSILAALSPERRRLRQLAMAGGPAGDDHSAICRSGRSAIQELAGHSQVHEGNGAPAPPAGEGRLHESDSCGPLRKSR